MKCSYRELRDNDADAYRSRHAFLFVPTWGPLAHIADELGTNPADLFALIHKTGIQQLAAAGTIDFSHLYGARFGGVGEDVLATVIAAVIAAVCPATAPFLPIVKAVVEAIITALMSSIQAQMATGDYGASPGEWSQQVQAWATEAAAA